MLRNLQVKWKVCIISQKGLKYKLGKGLSLKMEIIKEEV